MRLSDMVFYNIQGTILLLHGKSALVKLTSVGCSDLASGAMHGTLVRDEVSWPDLENMTTALSIDTVLSLIHI